jgi:predicted TPR repeat methyltransferase
MSSGTDGASHDPGGPPRQISIADAMGLAMQMVAQDRLPDADKVFEGILALDPDYPDAWNFRGIVAARCGRTEDSETLIRRAIALAPDYAAAHCNLGNVLVVQGRPAEAAQSYQCALALLPEMTDALDGLGNALGAQKRYAEAAEAYRRSIALAPEVAEIHWRLARAYDAQSLVEDALAEYRITMRLDPDRKGLHQRMGWLLSAIGRTDEAAAIYEGWLANDPENVLARHMLAACTGRDVAERTPDQVVRETFDGFAETFDEVLHNLHYHAPTLVAQAVANLAGEPARRLDVLDAGCGTGLCGEGLRPHARRLVGVDLSPEMVKRAARRGIYDQLAEAELVAFLGASADSFDLVASADTLVYFGELRSVMRAAAASLRPGGHFVFTLERAADEDAPAGFHLNPHGRYSHAEAYVVTVIQETGLHLVQIAPCHLRLELGRPVEGFLVIAVHAGGDAGDGGAEMAPAAPFKMGIADAMGYALKLASNNWLESAERMFERICATAPDYPDPWNYRGIIAGQRGRREEAEQYIRRAIELAPDYADAHNNLGNVLLGRKQYPEAVKAYESALALRPDMADVHHNLGNALAGQDLHVEATAAYHRALALAPDMVQTHFSLGKVYDAQGLGEQALGCYQTALRLSPGQTGLYGQLGHGLVAAGRLDEAAEVYARWLAAEPDSAIARHMLAACTGGTEARASDGFVRETFDGFAETFDKVLENLDYRAPALVAQAVSEIAGVPAARLDVLDAGCGTGLCGASLRPYARRLVGVDLSRGMLDRAAARGGYDELVQAELATFLAGCAGVWDLVVSADTLVYFGDLRGPMRSAAQALRPGGHLVFTVERAVDDGAPAGFRLAPHGRYSHSEAYLRGVINEAGLQLLRLARCHLRVESKQPVEGLLVVARR